MNHEGTPSHAVILASSEGHEPEAPWVLVPEEQLTHITTWAGKPANELIRADLTFFETPNNGAVFSTGSITVCGLAILPYSVSSWSVVWNFSFQFPDRMALSRLPE